MIELKRQRILKELNQYDISLKTGIPQSTISLLERGYLKANPEQQKRIAEALGMSEEEIFPKDLESGREVVEG